MIIQFVINKLFEVTEREKILCCVLHSYDDLFEKSTSDVDICVDLYNEEEIDKIIFEVCQLIDAKVVSKLHYDIPKGFYYAIRTNYYKFIKLDFLNDGIGINRYVLKASELLLDMKPYQGFSVPRPDIEYIYLLIKKVIKGEMLKTHQTRLNELYRKNSQVIEASIKKYFDTKSVYFAKQLLKLSGKKEKKVLLNKLRRAFFVKQTLFKPWKWPLIVYYQTIRVIHRIKNPTGIFVCILSPDGGGKTSVSKTVLERLLDGFRKTKYIHWRPGVLPQLRTLLGKSKFEVETPIANPHSPNKRGKISSFLRWFYYLTDYVIGYYLKLLPMKIRTTAIIIDRYYYDIIVDPRRYGFSLPQWLLKSVLTIIPKPDLTLYLDNTPEQLNERKQELPVAELKRQVEAWRDFIPSLPNAQIVTTDKPLDQVVENVVQLILTKRAEMTEKMLKVNPSAAKYLWNNDCTYSALPNKKYCQWIFPASKNAFQRSWSLYQPYSFKGKIYKRFLQINGLLLPRPKKSIKKEELNYREGDELRDILVKILKRKDLIMAVAYGTPSPYRKINGLVMTSEGEPLSFIKIGETEPARQRVKREAEILKRIEKINFEEVQIPQCLYSGKLGDSHVLIQTIPLFKGKKGGIQLDNKYTKILKILADKTAKLIPLHSSSFWQSLKDEIDNYPISYKGLLKEGLSILAQTMEDREISMGLAHGDFAPWNMFWNDKEVFIYDWESANEQAPVGIDLVHFLFQVGFLLKRLRGDRLLSYIKRKSEEPCQKLSLISGIKLLEKKTLIFCYLLHMAVVEDTPQQLSRAAVERRNLIKLIVHG